MKMIDLGKKPEKIVAVEMPSPKPKIIYPSFSVDKGLSLKMGQKVTLEGVVTGLRNDKYGKSTSFDVLALGVNKMSKEEFAKLSDAEQRSAMEEDVLGKKKE